MKIIKTIITFSAFICISTSVLYAQKSFQPNEQKIWHVDSEVHQYLDLLYLKQGRSLPSSSGPWSNAELKMWLYNIDYEQLTDSSKELYEKIEEILCKEPRFILDETLGISVTNVVAPEFYVHTNSKDFVQEDDWVYSYEERNPIYKPEIEFFAANNFYSYADLSVGWASNITDEKENSLYQPVFMSNIPFVPNKDITDLSMNFPTRAFGAFGANHWNFSFGRDVIRWGHGISGNLAVGGNQLYDNYMQYSLFYPKVKYNFLTIFYPHESNIDKANSLGQNDDVKGLKLFMMHKIEGRFFKDRLTAALGEAILYQSVSNTFDVRYLNPVGVFHNYYIRGNANSFLNLDLDFAVLPGLNIYTQILVDELAAVGEPSAKSDEPWRPSKMGYLLGTKYAYELPKGLLTVCAEGVYADPCLYLREEYDSNHNTQGVSFYGHLREFINGYGVKYIRRCIGYKYGGDCISGNLNFGYDDLDKLKLNLDCFYLAHGIMYNPFVDDWIRGKGATAPSTEDQTNNCDNTSDRHNNQSGEVEHFLRLSLSGSYDILPKFNVSAGIDNCFIWNKDNIKNDMVYDLQLHVGVKYSFLKN